ncbi:hypothetical protein [Mesorhizobium sp. M0843]|uniref:hypothetical protein n=1 Tax=Mesorhizobium sp. M0843 TaxID=2957010 RepID=UPI00333C44B8
MDSLELQDVFEPYYAERKRFTARKGKRALAESDTGLASRTATALPTNVRLSDSTTEH